MYELRPGDFGYRRRRNIESETIRYQTQRPSTTSTGIRWPNQHSDSKEELSSSIDRAESNKKNDELIPTESEPKSGGNSTHKSTTTFVIPTRPSLIPQPMGQKLTVYLAPEMITKLKNLKRQRCIPSISWLVGEAIQDYLTANGGKSINNE